MILLIGWFIIFPPGLISHMCLFIWIISGMAVLYRAKNEEVGVMSPDLKLSIITLGFVISIFSFLNIPIGFGNPPYSIGEFSILLCGISLILFGYLKFRPLLLPCSFPLIAIFAFQTYELFSENLESIASPLLTPTVELTLIFLNLLGVNASSYNHTITFLTRDNIPMYIPIVIDCTGIWSLGAFTVALFMVLLIFPRMISRKGVLFILIGYLGTYSANIVRVTLICLSGYFYGYSGVTQAVHTHLGWVAFSIWMGVFWYFFFSRYLLKLSKPTTNPINPK